MPHYRKHGKILTPISHEDFVKGMKEGHFCNYRHRAFAVLLYYSAIRKTEALRSIREQFQLRHDKIFFDVGKRLKHGIHTEALLFPLDADFMKELYDAIADTKQGEKVFKFSSRTAYNIIDRAFGKYPHFFRLNRITWFFENGYTVTQVRSFTGLTLKSLNSYLGLVDIRKMGESLKQVIK